MSIIKELFEEIDERIRGEKETKKGFVLLYKATDKADVDTFHEKCDSKGPTLTLLYGHKNTLFGGYTSQNWSSPDGGRRIKDEHAFLFSKNDDGNSKCIFLPIQKDKIEVAIKCHPNYGPTFGAKTFGGYDLKTFKRGKKAESEKTEGGLLQLNGSINVNNAYAVEHNGGADIQTKTKTKDINSGQMIVKSLEVYQVTDDECEEWLGKLEGEDFKNAKKKLIDLEPPPGLNIEHFNILLMGVVGAGKSSLINTISTVFAERVVHIAAARQSTASVTNKVTVYNIKTKTGDKTKIRLYDIRGYEDQKGCTKELELLLDGRISDRFQFSDNEGETEIVEKANPTLNDKIHFVCIVEGNSNFETYSHELLRQKDSILNIISKTGLPFAVVATKFDLLCQNILRDVNHLFKSPKAKDAVAKISQYYGVTKNHIFPVVNYLDEREPLRTKDQLALFAICEICKLARDFWMGSNEIEDNLDKWIERESTLTKLRTQDDKNSVMRSVAEKLSKLENENKKLRVLIVGPTGSGKSTFIDSIMSTFCNDIIFEAAGIGMACANVDTSTTEKFQLYCMKYLYDATEPKKSNVFLGDTPGFQEDKGITEDHIKFIINGNVPDKYKIINGIQETQEDFKREPTPGDKMHCICLVLDCENIKNGLSDTMMKSMDKLIRVIKSKDCPLMVVLTKCDKVSSAMSLGKIRVFEDKTVRICKDELMKRFRFKQQQIFPVINYVDDNEVDLRKDALLFDVFLNILKMGIKKIRDIEEEAS